MSVATHWEDFLWSLVRRPQQASLVSVGTHRSLGSSPGASGSVGLGWGLRMRISEECSIPRSAGTAVLGWQSENRCPGGGEGGANLFLTLPGCLVRVRCQVRC